MPRLDPDICLGVDYGDRRIGLAVGSGAARLPRPLETLVAPRGPDGLQPVLARLREVVKREGAGTVVVGEPLNMDGSAGERARASREFARRLKRALRQVDVRLQDERLSSFEADERMARAGIRPARRSAVRDAWAAVVILEDYFAALPAEPGEMQPPPVPEPGEKSTQ